MVTGRPGLGCQVDDKHDRQRDKCIGPSPLHRLLLFSQTFKVSPVIGTFATLPEP